jgi:hypothetical protein
VSELSDDVTATVVEWLQTDEEFGRTVQDLLGEEVRAALDAGIGNLSAIMAAVIDPEP